MANAKLLDAMKALESARQDYCAAMRALDLLDERDYDDAEYAEHRDAAQEAELAVEDAETAVNRLLAREGGAQ